MNHTTYVNKSFEMDEMFNSKIVKWINQPRYQTGVTIVFAIEV